MNFGDRISLPVREAGADGFLLGHIGPLIEHAGLSSGRTESPARSRQQPDDLYSDCSIFGGRLQQTHVRFCQRFLTRVNPYCSYKKHFTSKIVVDAKAYTSCRIG
jgi:hypothetical protein